MPRLASGQQQRESSYGGYGRDDGGRDGHNCGTVWCFCQCVNLLTRRGSSDGGESVKLWKVRGFHVENGRLPCGISSKWKMEKLCEVLMEGAFPNTKVRSTCHSTFHCTFHCKGVVTWGRYLPSCPPYLRTYPGTYVTEGRNCTAVEQVPTFKVLPVMVFTKQAREFVLENNVGTIDR